MKKTLDARFQMTNSDRQLFMGMFGWFKKECALRKADRLARRGNMEAALMSIEAAQQMNPKSIDTHIQRAWALAELRRFEEAMKCVDASLALAPKNGLLHLVKGEILYALKDYEGSKQMLHRALELSGENLRIEYMLGLVYVALNDMDRATQFFESSVRYDKSLVHSRLLAMAERYLFEHR